MENENAFLYFFILQIRKLRQAKDFIQNLFRKCQSYAMHPVYVAPKLMLLPAVLQGMGLTSLISHRAEPHGLPCHTLTCWPRLLMFLLRKTVKGRKIPECRDPFNRWNRSWDGWAAEDHALGNTHENQRLSQKLARKAAAPITTKRKKCGRLPDVDSIIKSLPLEEKERNDENSISTSSGTVVKKRTEQYTKKVTLQKSLKRRKNWSCAHTGRRKPEQWLDIPEVLRKLEDDCYDINRRKEWNFHAKPTSYLYWNPNWRVLQSVHLSSWWEASQAATANMNVHCTQQKRTLTLVRRWWMD